jgi:Histidine kinase-, DNA gyrase B-, and HSP90-like ATPase
MKSRVSQQARTPGGHAVSTEQEGMEPPLGEHEQAARSFLASHAQIVWSASADGTIAAAPLWRAYTGQGKEPVGGSGLGLYISKRFVEAMEGQIWVESPGINGQGSRFCVLLPSHSHAPGTTGA